MVLIGLMLGTILETLDVSIVNVAIPDMMGNLGCTLDQVNWVSTGYIIANVIVLPLSGWLSAYFGRRKYLAGSIIVFTAASFMCGMSRTLDMLIFFRIMQGAGGAALLSTSMATLLEIFPTEQHGLVAAIFGIGVMVGPTVGPTLGGYITDSFSWPWIFFINVPIGVPAALLTLSYMRDADGHEASGKIDGVGIGLLAIGVGSLQVVLERGNREDWFDSPMICWLSAIAVVGMAAFIWWEMRVDSPAVNLRVLRDRGLAAGTVFSIVLGFGLYGSLFILPVFLQQVRGYTAMQTGVMLITDGLSAAISMALVGKVVARYDARWLVAIGTMMFIGAMWMLNRVTMDTGPEHLIWPFILRGGSLGFLFVPLSIASLTGLQGKDMADGSGLFNLTRQWGGSAGIAFLSTLLDHRAAFHRAMMVENLTAFNPLVVVRFRAVQAYLMAKGAAAPIAQRQAAALMDQIVVGQSTVMAFEDAFLCIGVAFLLAFPLLLLFRRAQAAAAAPVGMH
jgi:DHA2 family multidrug resistance protein